MPERDMKNEEAARKIKEIEHLLPKPDRSRSLGDKPSGMMPFDEGAQAGRESAKVFKTSLQEFKRSFRARCSSIRVIMVEGRNKLSAGDLARILHLLCDGTSIRAITRIEGVSKNTVAKLLVDAGKACMAYHDEHVRNVGAKRVQVDEIWSFTYAKEKNVAEAKAAPEGAGDTWTWMALDAEASSW